MARSDIVTRDNIVITGVGLVTPLGCNCNKVLVRVQSGENVFAPAAFGERCNCKKISAIEGFQGEEAVGDSKTLRLMGRDAVFAVAAARAATADAHIAMGEDYERDDVALFGSTGTAGMAFSEAEPLVEHSLAPDGSFDIRRFGDVALKRVRPVLSFKILSNMPICFVSIFDGIQGPNAVYSPWEGQGAQAIEAGMNAITWGDASCALVGGCDTKANEFAYLTLEHRGVFAQWKDSGSGIVPAEGAAFLVLEKKEQAIRRGSKLYARIVASRNETARRGEDEAVTYARILDKLPLDGIEMVVSADSGEADSAEAELAALSDRGLANATRLTPKRCLGDAFAAAAAIQVALGALAASRLGNKARVLVNCLGHGDQKGAFVLEGL